MNYNASILRSCYESCLQKVCDYKIKSITFCCISTGIYEYPNKDAAVVAFDSIISWLKENHQSVKNIIFCTYKFQDHNIYNDLMKKHFPSYTSDHVLYFEKKIVHELPVPLTNGIDMLPPVSKGPAFQNRYIYVENENNSIDFSINTEYTPVKLQNSGHNVCFFNSVIQVLYSLPSFRTHILNTSLNSVVVHNLRKLFQKIQKRENGSEYTYQIVKDLQIPGYVEKIIYLCIF